MRIVPLLVAAAAGGCADPPHTVEPPIPVRAADLARAYRDDPATARAAYDGRPVLVGLTNPVRRGNSLHWHLAGPDFPAAVVCHFDGPPPPAAPTVWVAGTCRGAAPDGRDRQFPGYGFRVVVTGCRAAAPPRP